MKIIEVKTQQELNEAVKDNSEKEIRLVGNGSFEIYDSSQVRAYGSSQVTACDSSQVRAYGSSQVTAYGSSQVRAYGSSQVTACDSSQVRAYGSSQVTAYGSSQVRAYGSSQVTAYGSSQVRAYGSSQVTACDSSQVRAYGSSQVRAYGSSQVTACDSSQVTACDSSQVRACDSSQVRAYGSSQVTACDSSQVRAYGSSQVRACGSSQVTACDSSQVTATKYVAVTQQDKQAKIKGGVLIKLPTIRTAHQWCDFYDVPIKAGIAILYKALRNNYKTSRGFLYAPNTTPSAPDWDGGEQECGGGLHFSPKPFMALAFDNEATKFMACPVLVKEIKVHKNPSFPGKVKAPRIFKPCYEVDINGNKLNKG
jgi:hypothetical protein